MSPVMCSTPGVQVKPAFPASSGPLVGKLVSRAPRVFNQQLTAAARPTDATGRPAKRIKIIIRSQGGPRAKAALRQVLSANEPLRSLQRLGVYRCLSGAGVTGVTTATTRPLSEPSSPVSSDEAGSLADNEEACSPGSAGATNTDMLDELLPVSGVTGCVFRRPGLWGGRQSRADVAAW